MVLFNPKCKTLFKRDPATFKVTNELTDQRYAQVKDWLVTEKMDGMSVILSIDPDGESHYYGRSAKTNFDTEKSIFMEQELNYAETMLHQNEVHKAVDIYAELVGPGVQGNPHNLDALSLFVFDVRVNDFWLDWSSVVDIAGKAGLQTVRLEHPREKRLSTKDVVFFVRGIKETDEGYFEGYVARTDPYLYDNMGNRIMWKLKVSDY